MLSDGIQQRTCVQTVDTPAPQVVTHNVQKCFVSETESGRTEGWARLSCSCAWTPAGSDVCCDKKKTLNIVCHFNVVDDGSHCELVPNADKKRSGVAGL